MKLLLDENLPVKPKFRFLERGFHAFTLRDMRWLGKTNGELLQLMISNNFTTFITIDNNLSFQQNFDNYPIQVAILIAKDNTYETIMQFFDEIVEQLNHGFSGPITISHPGFNTHA